MKTGTIKKTNKLRVFFSLCSVLAVLQSLSCIKSGNLPEDDFNTWTFSGYVVDGFTNEPLSDVSVFYQLEKGEKEYTTGSAGNFYITDIPFGERNFRFSYDGDSTPYTEKLLVVSNWSGMNAPEGEVGDASKIIRLYPCTGSLTGTAIVTMRESNKKMPAESTLVTVTFKDTNMDNSTPSIFETYTDTDGEFTFEELPLASDLQITIKDILIDNITYSVDAVEIPSLSVSDAVSSGFIYLTTGDSTDWFINSVTSNVLSKDGYGLSNVPVDIIPYYILSETPDPEYLSVAVNGEEEEEEFETTIRIHDDTVFIDPVKHFPYNTDIAITLRGKTEDGDHFTLNFTDDKQFKTEQGMFPIASNTWDASGKQTVNFDLYDTMWVRFSEDLDENPHTIEWFESGAENKIYGDGTDKNADIRINDDTLFVKPDVRLAVDFGQTAGFKIIVLSKDGRRSDTLDFTVKLVESGYYILWTNTKDQFGKMRDDFNVMDTVIVVSSLPIKEITSISSIDDATPPPDMTLDNIKLHEDTIFYMPRLRLEPDTKYGIDFDITFKNGTKRSDVLPVLWQTAVGINIISVNNREGGDFKAYSAINDTLIVTFSKSIDTKGDAKVPFSVNIKDVNGIPITTSTKWNKNHNQATVIFKDTLPVADYDASPAYTSEAVYTRAVDTVTFNLTTSDGEQIFNLGPKNETIEIHTEEGLCPLSSNIIEQDVSNKVISSSESPVNDFVVSDNITITFNRMLDTARMHLYGTSLYAGLESKSTGLQLPCTVKFADKARSLVIDPSRKLAIGGEYFVWVKNVPAYDISGAAPINKHGGIYSGEGTGNRFLSSAFRTVSPDIRTLTAVIAPDTPTVAGISGKRLGISSGFSYSSVVGSDNINTESSLKFRITEVAWHEKHSDSVAGYQVQVQRTDRLGNTTNWYDYNDDIESTKWTSQIDESGYSHEVSIRLTTASFYSSFLTDDNDGAGSFYLNSSNLFNDSSQISIRVRPFIGTGDAGHNEVGKWSDPVTFVDNVAPCDSDFVTASNANSLARGGVQIVENIDFDNSGNSSTNNNGYIDITFPEDMDPNGPAPEITFYYGPFGGNNPPDNLSALSQSNWITARKYRMFISVPAFDFTHAASDSGAYYNISVADCRDISGNDIQKYGTDGSVGSTGISAEDRATRAEAAAEQKQGSSSVINGFARCD